MKRVLFPTDLIVFDPGAQTIEFNKVPNFDARKVMAILDITHKQTLIYAVASFAQGLGGVWVDSGSGFPTQLQYDFDTTGGAYNSSDLLQIIYDEGEVGVYDANGLPVYSSPDNLSERNGLDVNILNGSVIGQVGQALDDPYGDSALAVAFNQGGTLKSPHMDPVTNDIFTKVVSDVENPVYVNIVGGGGGTVYQGTSPWVTTPVNTSGTAYDTYFGATTLATQRVVLASDQATLQVGGTVSITTVSTLDVSGTFTTSGNSAVFSTTNYSGATYQLSVGSVTGTNPTLDLKIQESVDNITWVDIYQFQRITASSTVVQTPVIRVSGQYIRYVRTIGGTGPNFTFTINKVSRSGVQGALIRAFFDRTPNPLTVNSTTATYYVGGCTGIEMIVCLGAGGSGPNPHFILDFSEDGTNWVAITATDTGNLNANTCSNVSTNIYQPKYVRGRVLTAGSSGYTLNYVCIKGYGQ